MILVDTSIWVDHLRSGNDMLARLLEDGRVLSHPFVIGEIALGDLRQRRIILKSLQDLPRASAAKDGEVLDFIEQHKLAAIGIGYVDAHLLAAARLSSAGIWTSDKRLASVADRLKLAINPAG